MNEHVRNGPDGLAGVTVLLNVTVVPNLEPGHVTGGTLEKKPQVNVQDQISMNNSATGKHATVNCFIGARSSLMAIGILSLQKIFPAKEPFSNNASITASITTVAMACISQHSQLATTSVILIMLLLQGVHFALEPTVLTRKIYI